MMRRVAVLALLLALVPLTGAGTVIDDDEPLPTGRRSFVLVMRGNTFNAETGPNTPLLEAFAGDLLDFLVIVPPTAEPHTFHIHGHPWQTVDGQGFIDAKLIRPGEFHRFSVQAGTEEGHPGDWLYHCHMDLHFANGMWGILRVYPFSTEVQGDLGALDVTLHRMGDRVDVGTFTATFDGDDIPVVVVPRGDGRFTVVPTVPPAVAGDLALTAHTDLGLSVARLAVDGVGGYSLSRDVGLDQPDAGDVHSVGTGTLIRPVSHGDTWL